MMEENQTQCERTPLLDSTYRFPGAKVKDSLKSKRTLSTIIKVFNARKVIIMVLCFFLQTVCEGISLSLGVLYVELIDTFSSSRSQAALVQSVYKAMGTACGIFFMSYLKKDTIGICVMTGSLVASIGLVITSFSVNVTMVIVFTGVVAGLGMSISYFGSFVAISWSFEENGKQALAIMTIALSLGQALFPVLCNSLITQYNWNGAFMLLGGFTLNCVVCGLMLHLLRHTFKPPSIDNNNKKERTIKTNLFTLIKDYMMMLIMAYSFLYFTTAGVEMLFIVDLSVTRGLNRDTGSVLLTILGASTIAGQLLCLVILRLCRDKSYIIHMIYSFIFLSAAHFLIMTLEHVPGMVLGCILRGISVGVINACQPGMHIEARGLERYAETLALHNICGGIGNIFGGYFCGLLVDLFGGYDIVFIVATAGGACDAGLCLLLWFLATRRRRHIQK